MAKSPSRYNGPSKYKPDPKYAPNDANSLGDDDDKFDRDDDADADADASDDNQDQGDPVDQDDDDDDDGTISRSQVHAMIGAAVASHRKALEALKADHEKLKKKLEDTQAETSVLRVKSRRDAINNVFENAIASGHITPAAREKFHTMYNLHDDQAVMKVQPSHARAFIDEVKNVAPFKGTGRASSSGHHDASEALERARSRVGLSRDEIQTANGTTGEFVTALTEKRIKHDNFDLKDYAARERCFFAVLRDNPGLAKQYWADPNAIYVLE